MLKMNDLSKLTNTPKSTILYYIKEGLLPEPFKDKPNFHLYDEGNIQLIEFIKYLQNAINLFHNHSANTYSRIHTNAFL